MSEVHSARQQQSPCAPPFARPGLPLGTSGPWLAPGLNAAALVAHPFEGVPAPSEAANRVLKAPTATQSDRAAHATLMATRRSGVPRKVQRQGSGRWTRTKSRCGANKRATRP